MNTYKMHLHSTKRFMFGIHGHNIVVHIFYHSRNSQSALMEGKKLIPIVNGMNAIHFFSQMKLMHEYSYAKPTWYYKQYIYIVVHI